MKEVDIKQWNRKQHFEFFKQFDDPYFSVTVQLDVTNAHRYSKDTNISFFALYLHACMKAINGVENFKYRIEKDRVVIHEVIHASPTILRKDNTFGCSFIYYSEDFEQFYQNFLSEKERVQNTNDLFPKEEGIEACIYCSALPWLHFTGHKEPFLGIHKESVPKLSFGKFINVNNRLLMPVAIAVNHALVDGYHVGLFVEKFQKALSQL